MDILIDYVVPFLIVLTILVFVHELGHFLVARYNNVKVETFSIGFGVMSKNVEISAKIVFQNSKKTGMRPATKPVMM